MHKNCIVMSLANNFFLFFAAHSPIYFLHTFSFLFLVSLAQKNIYLRLLDIKHFSSFSLRFIIFSLLLALFKLLLLLVVLLLSLSIILYVIFLQYFSIFFWHFSWFQSVNNSYSETSVIYFNDLN